MSEPEPLLPAEAARRLGVETRVVIKAMYEERLPRVRLEREPVLLGVALGEVGADGELRRVDRVPGEQRGDQQAQPARENEQRAEEGVAAHGRDLRTGSRVRSRGRGRGVAADPYGRHDES